MLKKIATFLVARGEAKTGVTLDYARHIAKTDFGLMVRYGKVFGFLDPVKHLPPEAYHAARLRGALAADCGTCVEAEINLAHAAGLDPQLVDSIVAGDLATLSPELAAIVTLADAVTAARQDAPEARETLRAAYGEAGLIEISFAMNGAALLPGIKRAMGYATACDLDLMRKLARG